MLPLLRMASLGRRLSAVSPMALAQAVDAVESSIHWSNPFDPPYAFRRYGRLTFKLEILERHAQLIAPVRQPEPKNACELVI